MGTKIERSCCVLQGCAPVMKKRLAPAPSKYQGEKKDIASSLPCNVLDALLHILSLRENFLIFAPRL